MENYKCLDCDNQWQIIVEDVDQFEHVQFCPFCGENSIIIEEQIQYE
jgi:hypothetical protein